MLSTSQKFKKQSVQKSKESYFRKGIKQQFFKEMYRKFPQIIPYLCK